MEWKKLYRVVLCLAVGFIIFIGCAVGEVEEDFGPDDLVAPAPETDIIVPQHTLTAMRLFGDYLYDYEYNHLDGEFTCSWSGNTFQFYLEGLETNHPYIGSRSEMACYPLDDRGDAWFIACWTFVPPAGFFPSYWERNYFFLEKSGQDDNGYIGWFSQWIDVHGLFGCIRTFGITAADLEYVEK